MATMKWALCIGLLSLVPFLVPSPSCAAEEAFQLEIEGTQARVQFLEGEAQVQRRDQETWDLLVEGDILSHGDTVKTSVGSRIELALPDGSFLRFDEETTFQIQSLDVDTESGERDVQFRLFAGKTWAKVRSVTGAKDRFETYTKNAVAGIRGTTYRVNEVKDEGTLVRVYAGQIEVISAPRSQKGPVSQRPPGETVAPVEVAPPKPVGEPVEVKGPQAVAGPGEESGPGQIPGPKEVTMMEWVYLLRSMQQITIDPQGRPAPPRTFTPEEDTNDWVVWNQERDRKLGW